MRSYSVAEFRENLAKALDQAVDAPVIIQRNGREYEVRLRPPAAAGRKSGLDVPGLEGHSATLESLLEDIAAGRQRSDSSG